MSRRVVRSLPAQPLGPLRLGLCCQFAEYPVRFRTTTATHLLKLKRPARTAKCRSCAWRMPRPCWRRHVLPPAWHRLLSREQQDLAGEDASGRRV